MLEKYYNNGNDAKFIRRYKIMNYDYAKAACVLWGSNDV